MMSTLYFFLLLSLVRDALTGFNIIQDVINVIQLQRTQRQSCDLSKLPLEYQVLNCSDRLSPCDLMCNIESTNIAMDVCCIDGNWKIPNSGTVAIQAGHVRHKRLAGLIISAVSALAAAVTAGVSVSDILWRQSTAQRQTQVVHQNRKPPVFDNGTCPPKQIQMQKSYITKMNKKTERIYWNKPTAKDADGNVVRFVQIVAGRDAGSEFPEGHHHITYVAKDQHGYQAFCSFEFEVRVIRCDSPVWPIRGYRECSNPDPIYGTRCSFKCDEGFELSGDSNTECLNNGKWTGSKDQSCSKIKCRKPMNPINGEYRCLGIGNDIDYQSVCWAECNAGYELRTLTFSQCTANKAWYTNSEPICIDRNPPKITCVKYQHFYANSGKFKTNASWPLPQTEDNVDGNNVTIIQDSGPSIGSDLPVGFTQVQYHAKDNKRNESPTCTIVLYVDEITCSHPSLQLTDENMKFSCRSLNLGENCTLSCRLNLPLRGDKEITCSPDSSASNGKWVWSSSTEPYCHMVACPNLNAPSNGAMTCDTINSRPFCAMSCNAEHDLPYKVDGRFFCLDSGSWTPSSVVPNCTERRDPRLIMFASELHYYNGSCNDQSVLRDIKEKFLNIVTGIPTDNICIGCTIDNIKVTCGVVTRKRRFVQGDILERSLNLSSRRLVDTHSNIRHTRQTHITVGTIIHFDIVMPWNKGNMTLHDAYAHHDNITNIFQTILIGLVDAGKFNVSGWSGPTYQFDRHGILQCDNSFLDGDVCKTCSIGTQYNETKQSCEQCPLNTYQDVEGRSACKRCPSGHVTLETGRKHVIECVELCPAGSFSPTTAIPCTPCPVGSYQSAFGQKTCISCLEGKTTNSSGSTSEASCSFPDIEAFTADATSFEMVYEATPTPFPALTVNIIEKVRGKKCKLTLIAPLKQAVHTSMKPVTNGSWHMMILTLDSSNHIMTIRLKNEIVLQKTFSSEVNNTILMSGSSLRMDVGANTIIHFTGLFMASYILSDAILRSLSSSCTYNKPTSFLDISHISRLRRADIQVETPSSCDAVDECAAYPCGNNPCINSISGFECACLNGYSGPTCDVAPDVCQSNECKNGATCITKGMEYVCQCPLGYIGSFCEEAPVHGNWSEWSLWSICSASCGGGSRLRLRQCDSPPPGKYGRDCIGHGLEREDCNAEKCPKCPEVPLGIGTKVNTTIVDGSEIRQISCQDGFAFAPGFEPNQEYKCGISTNFQWTHTSTANPLGRIPSCSEVRGPQILATVTTVPCTIFPCSALSSAKYAIEQKLTSLQCVSKNMCNISVSTNCSSKNTVIATITLSASLKGKENLELKGFYSNQTVSDNLHDLVYTVLELEASTKKLVNETVFELCVQDGGRSYNTSTTTTGVVTCVAGMVGSYGVCVECPAGTYYEISTSSCQYCDIGTYQDKTAQTTCVQCYTGFTTVGVGSTSIQDCIVKPSTQESLPTSTSTFTAASTRQPDSIDVLHENSAGGETKLSLIIGFSLGSAAVIIISGATVIIIYRCKRRNPNSWCPFGICRASGPKSDVSESIANPTYMCPMKLHIYQDDL